MYDSCRELQDKINEVLVTHVTDPTCREICMLRYGFRDGESHTLDQIGKMYGISREAVRKKLEKTMAKIQKDEELQALFRQYMHDTAYGEAAEM